MTTIFGRNEFSYFQEIEIAREVRIFGNLFADYEGFLEMLLDQLESFQCHLPPTHIQTCLNIDKVN